MSITEDDVQQYKIEFNGFTIKFLEGLVDAQSD